MAQDIGRKIELLADWGEQQLPEIMAGRAAPKAQLTESGCVSQSGVCVSSRTNLVSSGRLNRRCISQR
jgi:hypothetical protein